MSTPIPYFHSTSTPSPSYVQYWLSLIPSTIINPSSLSITVNVLTERNLGPNGERGMSVNAGEKKERRRRKIRKEGEIRKEGMERQQGTQQQTDRNYN